jgi:hypothetical protein
VTDAQLVGWILLALLLLLVVDGIVGARGGYMSAFWSSEREHKVDHVVTHAREWRLMAATWVLILGVLMVGAAGFTILLDQAGEPVLAAMGLGLLMLGAFSWLVGLLLQYASAESAGRVRAGGGETPTWLEPMWVAAGRSEVVYVVMTALAYVVWGVAIVGSGFPAVWAGWAAIGIGVISLVGVAARPAAFTFPQLPMLVPMILGLALVIA